MVVSVELVLSLVSALLKALVRPAMIVIVSCPPCYDCHSSCRARLILVGGMLLMRLDSAWNRLESCAVKH